MIICKGGPNSGRVVLTERPELAFPCTDGSGLRSHYVLHGRGDRAEYRYVGPTDQFDSLTTRTLMGTGTHLGEERFGNHAAADHQQEAGL